MRLVVLEAVSLNIWLCCLSLSFYVIGTSQARFPKPLFESVQLLCEEQSPVPWISSIAASSRLRGIRTRSASLRCAHIIYENLRQSTSPGHLLNSIPTATPGQEYSQSRNQTRIRELSLHPVEPGRIRTQRLQHRSTVGSMGRKQSRPFEPTLEIGPGKLLPPPFLDGRGLRRRILGPMAHCTRRIGHS
jgi:hypothetical protein